MTRVVTVLAALGALLLTTMAGPAAANGNVTADKLEHAGWSCFPIPELGVHCTPDLEALDAGELTTAHMMVFDAEDGHFLGTELLVHEDAFNEQPCPQDGGEYLDVPGPYWACHHYETDH